MGKGHRHAGGKRSGGRRRALVGPPGTVRWRRFVAIGDSSTEGVGDEDHEGNPRGWVDRLAGAIAEHQGHLEYANLAIRGKKTAQIRDEQLSEALALRPDLVSVLAGMNDLLLPTFDPKAIAAQVGEMFHAFRRQGATVLTITMPDPTPNLPFTGIFQPRLRAFNQEIRKQARRHGVVLTDIAAHPSQSDPRLWSDDRLHGNSAGHTIVARGVAHRLGLPGYDETWLDPLPDPESRPNLPAAVRAQLAWTQQHALPWLYRLVTGRSVGDGMSPKYPRPLHLTADSADPVTLFARR